MLVVNSETLNLSGIYAIVNTASGRAYVGMAACFRDRWNKHRSDLDRNKHCCAALQADWSAFGSNSFEFQILEIIPFRAHNRVYRQREWFYLSGMKRPYNTALRFRV